MMDSSFAKKQLQKYGWVKGQGLGKKKDGITKPITVALKKDNAGVGASPDEEFSTHWWSSAFNQAASSITVQNGQDGVEISSSTEDDCGTEVHIARRQYGAHRKALLYGGFLPSSSCHCESRRGLRTTYTRKSSDTSSQSLKPIIVSDEELLEACDGRTAHKAARHGFKLSGKLKRIRDQEQYKHTGASSETNDSEVSLCSGSCEESYLTRSKKRCLSELSSTTMSGRKKKNSPRLQSKAGERVP